jgi:Formyl transferase
MTTTFKIVVLASGSGTNLQAILDTLHGRDGIEVVGVGSDKPAAQALERGVAAGVETAAFPSDAYQGRLQRDAAMADWVDSRDADLIVLAGYIDAGSDHQAREGVPAPVQRNAGEPGGAPCLNGPLGELVGTERLSPISVVRRGSLQTRSPPAN